MKKVMLIFDNPKECYECPCFDESDYCKAMDKPAPSEGILPDCPIRPLPNRCKYRQLTPYFEGYADGWNGCVQFIEE